VQTRAVQDGNRGGGRLAAPVDANCHDQRGLPLRQCTEAFPVNHDLGALELLADDQSRQQTTERQRRTASPQGAVRLQGPPLAPAVGDRHNALWTFGTVSDPVDEHVHAYNERNLERFIACFSPDCVIEDAQGTVVAHGHQDLRERFGRVFADSPELHCEILHRTRVGDYVVDEEQITGRVGGDRHGVVVSHVSNGLIDHQRFIR
jgi:hypothetical protein